MPHTKTEIPGDYLIAGRIQRIEAGSATYSPTGSVAIPITYYDEVAAAQDAAYENEAPLLAAGVKLDGHVNIVQDNPLTPADNAETFASAANAVNSIAWYYDAGDPLYCTAGQQYSNAGVEYICVQGHSANAPNFAPGPGTAALFKVLRLPYELWVQPLGAHDIYDEGDLVTWDAGAGVQNWRCNVEAGSSFAPGAFGWEVV